MAYMLGQLVGWVLIIVAAYGIVKCIANHFKNKGK